MRKISRIFLTGLMLLALVMPNVSLAQGVGIEEDVPYYYLGDFESGRCLLEHNSKEAKPIASMSKLMTYLVVKDKIKAGEISEDQEVVISQEAAALAAPGNSHFGTRPGETLTVGQLLMGMMVVSGNDAARQLAITSSGSEEAFVEEMNEKAKDLGLEGSSFYNASGLQVGDKQNSMTAEGVFKLARHIIRSYPEVLDYSNISVIDMPERNYRAPSTIPLIGTMPGVDGLKTGYTPEAGNCLTSTIDCSKIDPNKDYRLIGVVMGIHNKGVREPAMRKLFEYAIDRYQSVNVLKKDEAAQHLTVSSAENGEVLLYPKNNFKVLLAQDDTYSVQYDFDEAIKAPIKENQVLGTADVYVNDQLLGRVDLETRQAYKAVDNSARVSRFLEKVFKFIEDVFTV